MKKIVRPGLNFSTAFAFSQARYKNISWDDFGKVYPMEKRKLKCQLLKMQHGRCAYCECLLVREKNFGHIEHLVRRDRNILRTYSWCNLFVSCNNQISCGKWKDCKGKGRNMSVDGIYAPDDVHIDVADKFIYSSDGRMLPRKLDDEKAKKTIDIFNLNAPNLVNKRRKIIKEILNLARLGINFKIEELINEMSIGVGFDSCVSFFAKNLIR